MLPSNHRYANAGYFDDPRGLRKKGGLVPKGVAQLAPWVGWVVVLVMLWPIISSRSQIKKLQAGSVALSNQLTKNGAELARYKHMVQTKEHTVTHLQTEVNRARKDNDYLHHSQSQDRSTIDDLRAQLSQVQTDWDGEKQRSQQLEQQLLDEQVKHHDTGTNCGTEAAESRARIVELGGAVADAHKQVAGLHRDLTQERDYCAKKEQEWLDDKRYLERRLAECTGTPSREAARGTGGGGGTGNRDAVPARPDAPSLRATNPGTGGGSGRETLSQPGADNAAGAAADVPGANPADAAKAGSGAADAPPPLPTHYDDIVKLLEAQGIRDTHGDAHFQDTLRRYITNMQHRGAVPVPGGLANHLPPAAHMVGRSSMEQKLGLQREPAAPGEQRWELQVDNSMITNLEREGIHDALGPEHFASQLRQAYKASQEALKDRMAQEDWQSSTQS